MVHATVKRDSSDSFTVTFGDVVMTPPNNKRDVIVPSVSNSVAVVANASSNPATSKSISAASNRTNQLEVAKTAWKKVVEEVNKGIQDVSTYAEKEPERALKEAGELSIKLTAAFKVIDNAVKNEEKSAVSKERKEITSNLRKIFATANKAKKKGGRRTRRKHTRRTRRKHTRRKQSTHRSRK